MNLENFEIIDKKLQLFRYHGEVLVDVLPLKIYSQELLFLNLDNYKVFRLAANYQKLGLIPNIYKKEKTSFLPRFDFLNNNLLTKYVPTILNDKIEKIDIDLNFNSRKILDRINGDFENPQHLNLLAHVDYLGRYTYQIAFLKGMEDHLGIMISDHDAAVRMIFLEFSRILEYLYLMISVCNIMRIDFKKDLIDLAKRINNLLESFVENIPLFIFKLGGGGFTLNNEAIVSAFVLCKDIEKKAIKIKYHLQVHRKLLFWDWGKIDSKTAVAFGITGPTLRATGINYDVRKHRPYYFYKDMIYDIPLGIDGDVYDRIIVRIDDILESLKIIFQLCTNIPSITVTTRKEEVSSHYSSIETARGELGVMVKSGNRKIVQLDMTNPSLPLYLVLSELKGINMSYLELVEKSLHISSSELAI